LISHPSYLFERLRQSKGEESSRFLKYPINFCFKYGSNRGHGGNGGEQITVLERNRPNRRWRDTGRANGSLKQARCHYSGAQIVWPSTTKYWCGAGRMSGRKTNTLLASGLA
jgi:hypothetical protein